MSDPGCKGGADIKGEMKRAVKTYRWRNFPLDLSNDFQPPSNSF
jgi:hypothetical protein